MEGHPIENLMQTTMENIKSMIDVNTIVGDPVESKDGSTIIPVSKVSFGFASGGSEFSATNSGENAIQKYPFGGGSGAGVSIRPVAFIVLRKDSVRLLPVDEDSTYDKIIDSIPQILDMAKGFCKSGNKCRHNNDSPDESVSEDTEKKEENEI